MLVHHSLSRVAPWSLASILVHCLVAGQQLPRDLLQQDLKLEFARHLWEKRSPIEWPSEVVAYVEEAGE